MARRSSPSSAWVRSLQRVARAATKSTAKTVGKSTRSAARAGSKAVEQAARSALRAQGKAVREAVRSGARARDETNRQVMRALEARRQPPPGAGEWSHGAVLGPAGARRYRLFKPNAVRLSERLPLLVMLHGCGQDAESFARSTRMNRVAATERFLVLYVEQDRTANLQGCWNWYDTDSGRAYREAATIKAAIDDVARAYPVDRDRVAIAGMSAGASMAALLATRYPQAFKAVAMHSGIPPGAAHSPASALRAMRGKPGLQTGFQAASPGTAAPGTAVPLTTSGWPPLLVIHGDRDRVVSPANARNAVRLWAESAGGHAKEPRAVRRGMRHPVRITDFKAGRNTAATLCEVQGLAHDWSGGDSRHPFGDDEGPDASRMIWRFAKRHFGAGSAS